MGWEGGGIYELKVKSHRSTSDAILRVFNGKIYDVGFPRRDRTSAIGMADDTRHQTFPSARIASYRLKVSRRENQQLQVVFVVLI